MRRNREKAPLCICVENIVDFKDEQTFGQTAMQCVSQQPHGSLCNACWKSQVWCDMTLSAVLAQNCSSGKFRSKTTTSQTANKETNK